MRQIALLTASLALLVACAGPAPQATPSPTEPTAPASPTPPAEIDPEAEIERAIELRRDWGLRSDREWVLQVASGPNSLMSELGIAVSPDEAAELERMFTEDPRSRLVAYGGRHADEFGGLYVEGPLTVMLFTANLDSHRQALAALAPNMEVDLRPSRFTERELRHLQESLADELRGRGDVQLVTMGVDTIKNVVVLEAKSNDSQLKAELESAYEGRLLANIHPLPGPWQNVAEGPGWRLLAWGTARSEGYVVRVATDDDSWQEMWDAIDPVNERAEIDFSSEIVASFGHGIGSSCPEVRLDEVVIDHARGLVFSVTSDPLEPRACTADLVGGAFFVVALERPALPESPFTIALRADGIGGDDASVQVDLRP